MVDVSLISSGGGIGDTLDFMFTVDDANQTTFLVISAHEGQSDAITSLTVDGNAPSVIIIGGDGTTSHTVYQVSGISAGSHDLTITTGSGTYRYGYVLLKVLGWDGVYTVSQSTGIGTTAALSLETRTPDTVLSFITVDTNVTVTSSDTLLQSGTTGVNPLRVRFATSYEQLGDISWTLATNLAWALSIILLRGTDFHVDTPSHIAVPTNLATPTHVGTPGHIILNP